MTADCTISSFKTVSGNITINPAVTLTISPTGVLTLDLTTKHLLVKDTAKVIIRQGGAIAQTGTLTPPAPGSSGGGLVFHHPDHLTSASVDTDTTGTLIQLTDYYPYGDSRIEEATGTFHNDYTYTGKERDEDTALLYYEARYYDSKLGRFISLDPWGGDITDPQSLNKYAYVRNNPLKYVDPDGKTFFGISNTGFFNQLIDPVGTYNSAYQVGETTCLPNVGPLLYDPSLPSWVGEGAANAPYLGVAEGVSIITTGNSAFTDQSYAGAEKWVIGGMSLIPGGKAGGKVGKEIIKNADILTPQQEAEILKDIKGLQNGVNTYVKRIQEHVKKIKNPDDFIDPLKSKGHTERYREGTIKHWKKEIETFRNNIKKNRDKIRELKKRLKK